MLVFHRHDDLSMFRDDMSEAIQHWRDRKYRLVAYVRCDTLDDAFRLTNHIDRPWYEHTEVAPVYTVGLRSTSVGDIVVDNDGRAHLCCRIGWAEIAELGTV